MEQFVQISVLSGTEYNKCMLIIQKISRRGCVCCEILKKNRVQDAFHLCRDGQFGQICYCADLEINT